MTTFLVALSVPASFPKHLGFEAFQLRDFNCFTPFFRKNCSFNRLSSFSTDTTELGDGRKCSSEAIQSGSAHHQKQHFDGIRVHHNHGWLYIDGDSRNSIYFMTRFLCQLFDRRVHVQLE